MAQQHGVQVRGEQVPVVGDVARHAEPARGVRGGARRNVADAGHLELVRQRGEVGQVVDLGDGAAAHHADADALHGAARDAAAASTLRAANSFHAAASSTLRRNSSRSASHIRSRAAPAAASSPAARAAR